MARCAGRGSPRRSRRRASRCSRSASWAEGAHWLVLVRMGADEVLEEMVSWLRDAVPAGRVVRQPTVVQVRGRRLVAARVRQDETTISFWLAPTRQGHVLVRVWALMGRPSSWAGIEDAIGESLTIP